MNTLYKSEVDVAVMLLFFTRTDLTKQAFEQIRKARPARLYLYQDGPRVGRDDDVVNIKECREAIESMIDWECEVHRNYQEKNSGCDPSNYYAQKATEEMDSLWDAGEWDAEKNEAVLNEHLRTPYKYAQ